MDQQRPDAVGVPHLHRHGLPEEITRGGPKHEGPASAVIEHRGFKLVFRFAPGDVTGQGDLQELWVRPGSEPLEPSVLRRLAPQAELYLAHARAAMRSGGEPPAAGADFEAQVERQAKDLRDSAETLRSIAGPGRGLSDYFYELVGRHHGELVESGEPHPVKALGAAHFVTISTASRWIKEARRRGYIEGADGG